jgi:hypothetical protein
MANLVFLAVAWLLVLSYGAVRLVTGLVEQTSHILDSTSTLVKNMLLL